MMPNSIKFYRVSVVTTVHYEGVIGIAANAMGRQRSGAFYRPSLNTLSLNTALFATSILLSFMLCFPAFCADMVRIPAGPFTMGSDTGPEDERPALR